MHYLDKILFVLPNPQLIPVSSSLLVFWQEFCYVVVVNAAGWMCHITTGGPVSKPPIQQRTWQPLPRFSPLTCCPKALLLSDPCVFFMYCMFSSSFFLSDPSPLNPLVSAFDSLLCVYVCVFYWTAAVSREAICSTECSTDVCLPPMRKKKCLNIPVPGLHMAYEFISFSIAPHQHSCWPGMSLERRMRQLWLPNVFCLPSIPIWIFKERPNRDVPVHWFYYRDSTGASQSDCMSV